MYYYYHVTSAITRHENKSNGNISCSVSLTTTIKLPTTGAIQFSTVQYSTVQYSTVQYSTVQYSTVQYSTVQYSTVQYSTVQYSTVVLNLNFCINISLFHLFPAMPSMLQQWMILISLLRARYEQVEGDFVSLIFYESFHSLKLTEPSDTFSAVDKNTSIDGRGVFPG